MRFAVRGDWRCPMGIALPKTITDEEVDKLLSSIDYVTKEPAFWKTLFYLAIYMGLRQIEAIKVNIKDIDWLEKTLLIRHQKNKRKFEKVIIPDQMTEILKDHIKKYKNSIRENNGYLFFSGYEGYDHISVSTVRRMTDVIRERAGLTEVYKHRKDGKKLRVVSFHTLRHYYCQKIADAKGVYATQVMARHRSINSTMRYLHTSLKQKKEITDEVFNNRDAKTLIEEIKSLKEVIERNKGIDYDNL